MPVGPSQSSWFADRAGLADLRLGARQQDPAAARATAQQFEALFIQLMIRSMRDAGLQGELFNSSQMQTYFELHDRQIALDMARRGGIGLADFMVEQMATGAGSSLPEERSLPMPERVHFAPMLRFVGPPAPPAAAPVANDGWSGPVEARVAPIRDPRDFVGRMLPLAREAAARLGVSAEAIVAQSALETGWGRQLMRRPDGTPAWAMFGIKAGADWRGDTVSADTIEIRDGQAVRERARFRAYSSMAEAVADYARFLASRSRYAGALRAGSDPVAFAHGLQQGGYATDPDYARKLIRVLESVRRLQED